jgi:hypothetical protein
MRNSRRLRFSFFTHTDVVCLALILWFIPRLEVMTTSDVPASPELADLDFFRDARLVALVAVRQVQSRLRLVARSSVG